MNEIIPGGNMNRWLNSLSEKVGQLGLSPDMPPYQYRRGYAFNHMNFTGLIIALLRLLYVTEFTHPRFPAGAIVINALPAIACALMLLFMQAKLFRFTVYFSFIVFPALFFIIDLDMHDRGIIAYFIPYLIYPFFFLNRKRKIIPAFAFSALFFTGSFMVELFHNHSLPGTAHNMPLEILSITGALVLSFITLYSIKFQVWQYEKKILRQKQELGKMNRAIVREKEKLNESNSVKDKLFSIISHDLRIPMLGLTLLLSNEDDSDLSLALLVENLPELRSELRKTTQLFDDLLSWSKLQIRDKAIVPEKIDVACLVADIKESLCCQAKEKGITIAIAVDEPYMYADKNMIRIVLRNLVSNAIKFTRPGGHVLIRGQQKQNSYLLQVEDNGIGIGEATMEKILEREFYTTAGTGNEQGTGLGLIICRDLIEKCQGDLSIRSVIGQGTLVSVSLPGKMPSPYLATPEERQYVLQ